MRTSSGWLFVMVASGRALRFGSWTTACRRFMHAMNDAFPAVETMTAQQARAVLVGRRRPVDEPRRRGQRRRPLDPGPDGDMPVRIYRPHGDGGSRPAVVFCHGGGFVLCDLDSHDSFCRAMSRHTESVVVSVDYRLAPEHRAPAAAEDVFAAWCWVMAHADELGVEPSRALIAGDSAGGNLAAVTALMCREHGAPMPAGQVLIYPVIEPSFDTESYRQVRQRIRQHPRRDALLAAVPRRRHAAVA